MTISETIWNNQYNKLKFVRISVQLNTMSTMTLYGKCYCTVIVHIAPKIARVTFSKELYFSVLICIVLILKY